MMGMGNVTLLETHDRNGNTPVCDIPSFCLPKGITLSVILLNVVCVSVDENGASGNILPVSIDVSFCNTFCNHCDKGR